MVPEFPTTTVDDRVALEEAAARFLDDLGWSPPGGGSQGWRFEYVDIVTLDGRRAGVAGLLLMEQPADFPPRPGFVLCGAALDSPQSDDLPTAAEGLYIAMLDGRTQPYHVLPVTDAEIFPQSRDLGRVDAEKCRRPARP
jgi:hypothetical protein